jgi:hypothetical protein
VAVTEAQERSGAWHAAKISASYRFHGGETLGTALSAKVRRFLQSQLNEPVIRCMSALSGACLIRKGVSIMFKLNAIRGRLPSLLFLPIAALVMGVVMASPSQAAEKKGREIALMQWGLIPWFSKQGKPSYSTINARAEGVQTNASYREPLKTRRCLVPASGSFEWTSPKNDRQPHSLTRADGQPMALAGLRDRWRSEDKSETKETFTIVTTQAGKFAAQYTTACRSYLSRPAGNCR